MNSLIDAWELKKFRKSNGLTQSQVADLLYVTTRRIENWEQGISPMPLAYRELLEFKVGLLTGKTLQERLNSLLPSSGVQPFGAPLYS